MMHLHECIFLHAFFIVHTERIFNTVWRKDSHVLVAPENYPSSTGFEPLLFIEAGGVADWKRTILRNYPLIDYSYFVGPPLPRCDHPTAWVKSRGEEITDFKGNGTPVPSILHKSERWPEYRVRESYRRISHCHSPSWYDRWWPTRIIPFQLDFCHFATVNSDTRFTNWLCDCLHRFEGRLKMAGYTRQ